MKSERLLALGLLILLTATGHGQDQVSRRHIYKQTAHGDLGFGLIAPEGHKKTDRRPAVVIFFGGGWVAGRSQVVAGHARFFARHGYVGITPKYRIRNKDGDDIRPFHCVEDGKSLIRYLRANADELGIDPKRIIAGGISAGGHVAACTGIIDGFDAEGEDRAISSVPNGLLLLNPVLDTTPSGYRGGFKLFNTEAEARRISPCHHIKSGQPPAFVVHGKADPIVPYENSERFAKLMQKAGNHCQLLGFADQRHGMCNRPGVKGVTQETWDRWTTAALAFFEQQGLSPK